MMFDTMKEEQRLTLHKINKKYKDRLFRLIFQDKKDLLELYNAINNSDYTNPEDLTITTIEDVVYMGMKNDLSFLIDDVLNLYEHQSSFSPNLPLRGLFYFSSLYREQIEPVVYEFTTLYSISTVSCFLQWNKRRTGTAGTEAERFVYHKWKGSNTSIRMYCVSS